MEEATEVCWYCKGEPRFSATSFCGVCYGTGYAPRSTRMRAEFNDGPLVVSGPCPSCESLRAELAALTAKCRELDARLGGIIEDERERRGESQYRSGLVVAYEHGRRLLRELGLLARIEKEGE